MIPSMDKLFPVAVTNWLVIHLECELCEVHVLEVEYVYMWSHQIRSMKQFIVTVGYNDGL